MSIKGLAAIAAIVVAAGIIIVVLQQQKQHLAEENSALRKQVLESEQFSEQNRALTEQAKKAEDRARDDRAELLRLRGQAAATRKIEQENARLKTEQARLGEELKRRPPQAAPAPQEEEQQSPERAALIGKLNLSRQWGLALMLFANANGGHLPESLGAARNYFDTNSAPPSVFEDFGVNSFELVYHGSLEGLSNTEHLIVAREKDPAPQPDGRLARTYLFMDGHSEVLTAPTADGFAAREKELNHVAREAQ